MDAFLRVGASLGVPDLTSAAGSNTEAAFRNLARRRPEESVLASLCTELKGLLARLAADPRRAVFVSSVTERLILHCADREEDLRELKSSISLGCPANIAKPLSQLIDSKIKECGDYKAVIPGGQGKNSFRVRAGHAKNLEEV